MSIGNRYYVRKRYPDIVKIIEERYDEVERIYIKKNPRAQKGRVHVALETHTSRHTWAWHGIRAYRAGGQVYWRPASFYGGYAYIRADELLEELGAR